MILGRSGSRSQSDAINITRLRVNNSTNETYDISMSYTEATHLPHKPVKKKKKCNGRQWQKCSERYYTMRHDSGIPKKTKSLYQGKKKNAFRCFTSKNSNSQLIISRSTCTLVRARSQSSACLSLPLTHACFRDLGNSNEKCRKM